MNIIEMQPSALPPSFPISDTRPSHTPAYLDQARHATPHVDARESPKANIPMATSEISHQAPRSVRGQDAYMNGVHVNGQHSPQTAVVGKKRSADGQLKETLSSDTPNVTKTGHSRNTSTLSNASNSTVAELSQQLRTKLTYAMIKVQNGWQNRSLDEVESLANSSPRSTTFNHYSNNARLLSPRAAMTAHLNRQGSDSSSNSDHNTAQKRPATGVMSPPLGKRGLAPPATIVSRPSQQRRRPTPNVQLQKSAKPPSPSRPAVKHRTPSQNAAMEADAVETLLFMASPNNSGYHSSQFSPVTSAPSVHQFPSQTSPLRYASSAPTSPKRVAFAANGSYPGVGQSRNAIIASMIEKLDEDGDAALDEALQLIDRHHAAKLST